MVYRVDAISLRKNRQIENNNIVYDCLRRGDQKQLYKVCNKKQLEKTLIYTELSLDQLFAADETIHKIVASSISILSSRQGKKDEVEILEGISTELLTFNVKMDIKNKKGLRPLKKGGTVYKKNHLETLKSFDAILSGNINGYVFAKVMDSDGGHQDNVINEANAFLEWATNEPTDFIYAAILDSNHHKIGSLQEKYIKWSNVWVCNHVEFQYKVMDVIREKNTLRSVLHNEESIQGSGIREMELPPPAQL